MSFGNHPLANQYLDQPKEQERFPLAVTACNNCGHVQLTHTVNPRVQFDDYPYVSGTSQTLRDHFKALAKEAREMLALKQFHTPAPRIGPKKKVLEIAANDGTLLKEFKELGCDVLGIDPARNLVPYSQENGVTVISEYWNRETCEALIRQHGKFDLVVAVNVLPHVENPREFLELCQEVCDDEGLVVIQTSQCDMFKNYEFDCVYEEHRSFFTVRSLSTLAELCKLHPFRFSKENIHSKSFRAYFKKTGEVNPKVLEPYLEEEYRLFGSPTDYYRFLKDVWAPKVRQIARKLASTLKSLEDDGYTIVGYGACYDTKTRVVTPQGLKHHYELKVGDVVLTINPETKVVEHQPITEIMLFPYKGKLIHFQGKRVDLMVTPNHRMMLETRGTTKKLVFEEAEKTKRRKLFKLPIGTWLGVDQDTVDITPWCDQTLLSGKARQVPTTYKTEDLLYLVGLFAGDGYICTSGGGYSSNFCVPIGDKARKPLEETLQRMGLDYRSYDKEVQVASVALTKVFADCGTGVLNKKLPEWALAYSDDHLVYLFKGLIDSDGWYEGKRGRLKTSSESLVASAMELGAKLSLTVSATPHEPQTTLLTKEGRPVDSKKSWTVNFGNTQAHCYTNSEVDYVGDVWCLRVPNGNFLVERNGKTAFCGNSAKGNTLLNWRTEINLDYMVDDNPLKQGKYTPGRYVPIYSPLAIATSYDKLVIVLTAWNFAKEIRQNLIEYGRHEDYIVTYVPEVKVQRVFTGEVPYGFGRD